MLSQDYGDNRTEGSEGNIYLVHCAPSFAARASPVTFRALSTQASSSVQKNMSPIGSRSASASFGHIRHFIALAPSSLPSFPTVTAASRNAGTCTRHSRLRAGNGGGRPVHGHRDNGGGATSCDCLAQVLGQVASDVLRKCRRYSLPRLNV